MNGTLETKLLLLYNLIYRDLYYLNEYKIMIHITLTKVIINFVTTKNNIPMISYSTPLIINREKLNEVTKFLTELLQGATYE